MRKILLYSILLIGINACKKSGTTNPTADVDITVGTWRISYYWDQKDETNNFSTYYFMFLSNGTFMAHDNSGAITGTWSISNSRLAINFTNPLLGKLNNNWLITEKTSASIKLKDDNSSQDDKLYFTKN